jgi:threonine dehydratase
MTARLVEMTAILAARQRIAPWIRRTPLVRSTWLSDACGADVRLKLESLQVTHSFKARGAFNAALTLREQHAQSAREGSHAQSDRAGTPAQPRLVAASSGNHGRALANAAQALGLPCIVYAPASTPATKLHAIRAAGAELRTTRDYDAAEAEAKAFAAAQPDAVYVSPYDDPLIVAGTGTIGLDIIEEHPDVDVILVPVGGGGLISGVATAAKSIKPDVRVIGVEAEMNPALHTVRRHGRGATIPARDTLADALAGNVDPDSLTLDIVDRFVDDIVLVSEDAIAATLADIVDREHVVVEGGGAVAPAALATNRVDVRGKQVVAIVSGGNIDRTRLAFLLRAADANEERHAAQRATEVTR